MPHEPQAHRRVRSLPAFRRTGAAAALAAVLTVAGPAQSFTGGFPFPLPGDDSTTVRFFPSFPRHALTSQDFVSIDAQGHFSVRGAPVRFFGVNLVSDGAFPPQAEAGLVAGRMRKMGINLVRMHHMDNPWSSWSLFGGQSSTRTINEAARGRLEFLLSKLRENGLYANINLHVSRTYRTSDGIPEADSLVEYGKYINYFDPYILSLDKEFARQLLTHVNPYTQTSLVNDPVMAMVEVTNENSLYRLWRDGGARSFSQGGSLTFRHTTMLDTLFQSFLRSTYGTTASLRSAWGSGVSAGVSMISNGTFETASPWSGWSVERSGSVQAVSSRDAATPYEGTGSAKVVVTGADGSDWHAQWKHVGLTLEKDSTYLVTFAARADSTRRITLSVMNDVSPWTWYGGTTINLLPSWQVFTFSFRQPEAIVGTFRLSFGLGLQAGTYWFDAVTLKSSGAGGLDSSESLEAGTVKRILYADAPKYTEARVADQSAFYIGLQQTYFAQMRSFLRDTLGVHVPIVGTNWNVGPADLAAQSSMDYLDNHAYWDHPSFPGVPWSSTDWTIGNTPMVRNSGGGTMAGLMSGVAMKGKPYTISEYNHAYPNLYQSEAVLFLSAYSAFHDVDGFMLFDYSSALDDWTTDRVAGYFSIHRNTAMMSLLPSCAAAYRSGFISTAHQTVELAYAPSDYLALPRSESGGWLGPSIVPRTVALQHAVRASTYSAAAPLNTATLPTAPSAPYVTDTGEITWDPVGLFTVASPGFAGVTGDLDAFTNTRIGPARILYGSGYATFTWISLTGDSLPAASRSMMTLATRVQNTGMQWFGTTTVRDQWGSAPTTVAPFGLVLEAAIRADSIRVIPLDATGKETTKGATILPSAPNTFTIPLDPAASGTVWFGIESASSSDSGVGPGIAVPQHSHIEATFPNPVNGRATVRIAIAESGTVIVRLHDILGREVKTIVSGLYVPGTYDIPVLTDGLASGLYCCVLTTPRTMHVQKMMVLK